MLGNVASAFVEVAIDLRLGIVGFDESDGLFEVIGGMEMLARVVDEIPELIVIGIVTEGFPSHWVYLHLTIFLVHGSSPQSASSVSDTWAGEWGWGTCR